MYDGLSHLYTDCDSRLRHIPSTNYADKKRKDESSASHPNDPNAEAGDQRVKSPEAPVSPRISSRISSPHRMSDSELAKQQQQQTEDQKSKQIAATSELGLIPANLGSVLNETSSKKKSKKSQNLPAGVNERDVELFTVSQETAKNFLIQENSRGKFHSSSSSEVPSNINTTTCKQTADTNTNTGTYSKKFSVAWDEALSVIQLTCVDALVCNSIGNH